MDAVVVAAASLALALSVAARIWNARRRPAVVLGKQVVSAEARERAHREKYGHLPSPLPPERYDDLSLIDPRVSDLDLQLRSLDVRPDLRNGATADDFFTLLVFARRAAVFALRDRDEARIREALNAVAMVDAERIDEREIPVSLALINHAAERLGLRTTEMFDAAAALAVPRTAAILRGFVRNPSDTYRNIEESWGYHEIETGFVQWDFEPYEATRDLLRALLVVRDAIGRDCDVILATSLPPAWFPEAAEKEAATILWRRRGAGSVETTPSLSIYIVEAGSDDDAAALQRLARSGPFPKPATITVQDGPLFAMAIEQDPHENVQRFEGVMRDALRAASA